MTSETPLPDVSALSYEQARDELAAIVNKLESGSGSLEDSLTLWERGELLAARCQEWLDHAQARLDAANPDAASLDTAAPSGSDATKQDSK